MTAYRIAPVDSRAEWERSEVIDVPSREELLDRLERAETLATNESRWKAIAQRRAAEAKAVLRELSTRSPELARAVESAKAAVKRRGTWAS